MPDMRSNKVWNEETSERVAVPPSLVENNNGLNEARRGKELAAEKTDENGRIIGSLAAAEALQAATDERRGKEVTKIKH